jgi:hypothetical protein
MNKLRGLIFSLILSSSLSYAFSQSVPCNQTTAVPIKTGITLTTYQDSTIVDGNTYYYIVASVDTNGNYSSPCSNISGAAVVPSTGTHTATLTWTASTTPNVTYAVFRAITPQPPTGLTVVVN